jgi:hypothetical protein
MDWQSAPASDRFKFGDVVATVGLFNGRVKAGPKAEVTSARAIADLIHKNCPVLRRRSWRSESSKTYDPRNLGFARLPGSRRDNLYSAEYWAPVLESAWCLDRNLVIPLPGGLEPETVGCSWSQKDWHP